MLADTGMRHREELGAMTRSWIHFDESPFPRIVVPGEAAKNRVPRTIPMTKRVQALLHEIMENGLVFDVRTDTNDNGGGKVREYRCPARHRIVPYTSIRKSLSSAGHRAGLGHVRPHDLRHTFVTRMLDLSVPIEQVNYLAGHKSMAMTKRYDHANEERYGAAIEALDAAGKTSSAEALAAARWKRT
jgi:integrase